MTDPISPREAEVLAALGERLSNAQIAHRLRVSVRTVESHVSSLLRKYGAADRRALAEIAGPPAGPAAVRSPGTIARLPAFRTTFVGRNRDRAEALAAFDRNRLVTLVGPGGVGKTRLASVIAAAAGPSFPLGGAFVDLVPVRDGFVAQAVAAVLGATERPQQRLPDAIVDRLGRGRSLLVLDNCEHLVEAAAGFVDEVLSHCPEVRVLATSRERLGVAGEQVVPVAPLALGSDAESLFRDRAAAVDPALVLDRGDVAELCARLDGVPLAIELAAARTGALGVGGVRAALDDTLRLLAGGRAGDRRHRSLRAVVDWSYDLLDEEEQALFRRLAVFAGSFDLDAAVAVVPDCRPGEVADVLGRLADKNLVRHGRGPSDRWQLLATVRAYAWDRLAGSGEQAAVQARHLRWAAEVAARLEDRAAGEGFPAGDGRSPGDRGSVAEGGSAGGWREDLDAVSDDLRAALASPDVGGDAHRLARSLGHLAYARRFLREAVENCRQAARRTADPGEAARDLRCAADCAHAASDPGLAYELLLAAAAEARAAGDRDAEAVALAGAVFAPHRFPGQFRPEISDRTLADLYDRAVAAGDPENPVVRAHLAAAAAWHAGPARMLPDPELAEAAAAAARATGDPVLISAGLDAAAAAAAYAGRFREAHRLTGERLALLAAMRRDDPYPAAEIVDTFRVASSYAIAVGDLPAALAVARRAATDDLVGGHPFLSTSMLITPLVLMGEVEEAFRYAPATWEGWTRAGRPPESRVVAAVAAVALGYGLRGDREQFRLWQARARQVRAAGGFPVQSSFASFVDLRVAVHTAGPGHAPGAADLVAAAFAVPAGDGCGGIPAHARADTAGPAPTGDTGIPAHTRAAAAGLAAAAELAVVARLPEAPQRLAAAAPAAAESDWAAACLARAAGRRHGDPELLADAVTRWERIGARFEADYTRQLLAAAGFQEPV